MVSADDMGLGKTLTMISLILKQNELKKQGNDEDKAVWLNRDKQLEKSEAPPRLVTLSPLNKLSSTKFLVCFNFQNVFQFCSKLVKMLPWCQTAWIWVRC